MNNHLSSQNSIQHIRRLPAQDALILIKQNGLSDSKELLSALSPKQLNEIFDLDAWQFDQVDFKRLEDWFEALLDSNFNQASKVFRHLDIELLAFLLKSQTEIYNLHADEYPQETPEQALFTPDRKFLVVFKGNAIWKHLLEQLIARDLKFSLGLIETIRFETASNLEEEALRWRDGRLQDKGFLPLAELKSILAPIDPNTPFPRETSWRGAKSNVAIQAESSALLRLIDSKSLFLNTLKSLPEPEQSQITLEFISLCNQVHLAYNREAGDLDSLKETVLFVTLMLDKALKHRSSEILKPTRLRKLFQIGHSLEN